jgi:hypothetical protein
MRGALSSLGLRSKRQGEDHGDPDGREGVVDPVQIEADKEGQQDYR